MILETNIRKKAIRMNINIKNVEVFECLCVKIVSVNG